MLGLSWEVLIINMMCVWMLIKGIISLAYSLYASIIVNYDVIRRNIGLILPEGCNLTIVRVDLSCMRQAEIGASFVPIKASAIVVVIVLAILFLDDGDLWSTVTSCVKPGGWTHVVVSCRMSR